MVRGKSINRSLNRHIILTSHLAIHLTYPDMPLHVLFGKTSHMMCHELSNSVWHLFRHSITKFHNLSCILSGISFASQSEFCMTHCARTWSATVLTEIGLSQLKPGSAHWAQLSLVSNDHVPMIAKSCSGGRPPSPVHLTHSSEQRASTGNRTRGDRIGSANQRVSRSAVPTECTLRSGVHGGRGRGGGGGGRRHAALIRPYKI